jgi:hypothetical protein
MPGEKLWHGRSMHVLRRKWLAAGEMVSARNAQRGRLPAHWGGAAVTIALFYLLPFALYCGQACECVG